jgi:hypothetical protein
MTTEFFDPRPVFEGLGNRIVVDGATLCVRKPERYLEMVLPAFPQWLRPFSREQLVGYWTDLRCDEARVACLNSVHASGDGMGSVYCDYCKASCANPNGNRNGPRFRSYRMCSQCHMDMCELCYEEVDEAAAAKNGSQNWHKRRDQLRTCREHGMVQVDAMCVRYMCDVCSRDIHAIQETWKQAIDESTGESTDVCSNCEPTEDMKGLAFREASHAACTTRFEASGFGSMLDWLPIGHDTNERDGHGTVLLCLNPESPSYGHVALSHGDDHGRYGYFDIGMDFAAFLQTSEHYIHNRTEHEAKAESYYCDICAKGIKSATWLQASGTRTSVDICSSCKPTQKMLDEHTFYTFPPGPIEPRASSIVSLWLKAKGLPRYYG